MIKILLFFILFFPSFLYYFISVYIGFLQQSFVDQKKKTVIKYGIHGIRVHMCRAVAHVNTLQIQVYKKWYKCVYD